MLRKRILAAVIMIILMLSVSIPAFAAANGPASVPVIRKGTIFTYGTYEQDGDESNGQEPILWLALENLENDVLCISVYGLDLVAYHPDYTDITWETCALREWMNDSFLNTAFTEEEQASILLKEIRNSNTTDSNTMWRMMKNSEPTEDKIFALDCHEAEGYFGNRKAYSSGGGSVVTQLLADPAYCVATPYAVQQGAMEDDGYCYWWLRGAATRTSYAAFVGPNAREGTTHQFSSHITVRPAMWLNVETAPDITVVE